jgi:hypothetical protein
MPVKYFDSFPTVDYDIEKDNETKKVTDITKRIGIRSNFNVLLPAYYKETIDGFDRPEHIAYELYDDPYRHWILLHINGVVDPYFDWVMDSKILDDFLKLKYPNTNLLLVSTHHTDSTYDSTFDPTPVKRFFKKGEIIREYQSDGTVLDGVGVVTKFNPTLIQITYTSTSGAFTAESYVKGDDSGAVGKIEGVTTERVGVHHYENSEDIEVGRNSSGATAIDNQTYEENQNELNRIVFKLRQEYVEDFENEFENKIR